MPKAPTDVVLSTCLGCLRDAYPGVEPGRVWPIALRICHVCGMETNMGYVVPGAEEAP